MKKKTKISVVIIILTIIMMVVGIVIYNNLNNKEIYNRDDLYQKVEQYLIMQEKPHYFLETKDSKPNTNIEDFKVFIDIAKLGIRESNNEIYVYVWALVESYYVQDNKLIHNSGSSIPYKFIIKDDEIVDYEMPLDGSRYFSSIKKIFPKDIVKKLDDSLVNSDKLKTEVDEYYSYLKNN